MDRTLDLPDSSPSAGHAPNAFLSRSSKEFGKPIRRFGLASRGANGLGPDDVLMAVSRGVNFLNWPGLAEGDDGADGMSVAIADMASLRESIVVCVQFGARTAREAAEELRSVLSILQTNYVDVLTLYYVEHHDEFARLSAPDGAMEYLRRAKADGIVRRIGVTSHQRPLAVQMARSGLVDLLMIRYNAAHRGAEREVFPVTDKLHLPIIAYTAQRWGALARPTSEDPAGFVVPRPPDWYRFVLHSASVSVVLSAPTDRSELEEDLAVLNMTGPLPDQEYERLAAHGERVRCIAGKFP
jgi:aryl-alcohol dehydrogenase-like predicted oxidoreductase